MSSSFDLSGVTALVTGSARGIGRALAGGLAAAGARVIVHATNFDAAEDAASSVHTQTGADVTACAFDITDEPAVTAAINRLENEVGEIGVLINNAGIQHRQPLLDISVEDWRRVIDVNLTGAFIVGRGVARRMLPRERGKIINICSVQSELARPGIAPYTAAKGGLRNLTRAMAAEWAPAGLQVNAIAPGYLRSDMTDALSQDPAFSQWLQGRTPAGRWGTPDDLVGAAIWLSSPASAFVNGQTIFVDGGLTTVV
ncbi:glucose 1-dehydrogenase [Herbiconiux moechotypicola]|uniref:SDR family oxidoreductase n=1 Tax=Herbiconiux moechotypicola TaxID=637393 RepID=A0ABN3E724_9MICO|nr:glucose 1-dehydrogenase [Herbiconiux moechotypicola]MCS5732007.1 glucose 1-dehydrogenase [Herbiconiux moechotypicola]